MDLFGKTSNAATKKKSPFQTELAATMRERKARGLAADLTETEEDDDDVSASDEDDLLATFTKKTNGTARSQSSWKPELEAKQQPPKPQMRTTLKDNQSKHKIPFKPTSELDHYMRDDIDEVDNMGQTQKKPWQPPQFKEFSTEQYTKESPSLEDHLTRQTPLIRKPQHALMEEDEDEELTGAYTRQLEQMEKQGKSPLGQQSPSDRLTPTNRQSPFGDQSKVNKTEAIFGSLKSQKPGNSINDIFGKRKSPTDPELFGGIKNLSDGLAGIERGSPQLGNKQSQHTDIFGRKTPQEVTGRKTPQDLPGRKTSHESLSGRKTPQGDAPGRKTPQGDATGRKTPQDVAGQRIAKQDMFGRGSPKSPSFDRRISGDQGDFTRQSAGDNAFGRKTRTESPPFQSKQFGRSSTSPFEREGISPQLGQNQAKPQPTIRKGSYMSKLLAETGEEKDSDLIPKTRTSYINNLLNDDTMEKSSTRSPFLDNLLGDDETDRRQPRPRQRRQRPDDSTLAEERESSVGRDVNKDPMMIAQMEKEREERRQKSQGAAKTEGEQASFDIEEVADAQNPLAMTYIQPETVNLKNKEKALRKPQSRRSSANQHSSPSSSDLSFESASDIRNYIYKEWSEKKLAASKTNLKEKKRQEKEEELKKQKEKDDKRLENEATFRTWKKNKSGILKEQVKSKRLAEEKEKEKLANELQKKQDAAKIFKKWKESKDEEILENREKQRKSLSSTLAEKQELEARKQKEAEGAFLGWKKAKERQLQKMKQQEKEVKQNTSPKMNERRRREIEAEQLYDKWLQKKEEQNKKERMQAKRQSNQSPRPAWSPANKTIPYGR